MAASSPPLTTDEQVYLVNKETGNKFLLNGFIPSDEPSDLPKFSSSFEGSTQNLPKAVDLRECMTPVETQAQLNSCTGNALAGALEFLIKRYTGLHIDVSRLFIYYNARLKDGLQKWNMSDRGCTIRSAVAALAEQGCCKESLFEYEPCNVNQQPPAPCYVDARKYRLERAEQITADVNTMKACLAEGFPFAFGLRTFESFAQAETNGGRVYMPREGEAANKNHNWHAMLAVGYSDAVEAFIVRNSWGPTWGDKGYCYIPYEYMGNPQHCKDLHAIKEIASLKKEPSRRVTNGRNPYNWEKNQSTYQTDGQGGVQGQIDSQWFWKEVDYLSGLRSIFNAPNPASSETKRTTAIERISKHSRLAKKFYILWIDEQSAENTLLAKKIEEKGNLEVEFSGTYANGERYLLARKAKIQESMRFLIICRGYFRNEKKNPLNLLKFLDQNQLSSYSVIVFTRDKDGLSKTLDEQASEMGVYGWRRRVHVTNEVEDLMSKIDYHLKN